MKLDWKTIDTVLLDMDGTLLDLNFDNHFWKKFVPSRYAELHGMSLAAATAELEPRFKRMEGHLEWYCLDYWSRELSLDIVGLKTEISGLIRILPHVTEFLEKIRETPKTVLLVTNAHRGSLGLKMEKTCLQPFFDAIISSHDLGLPKENPEFWRLLQQHRPYNISATLLIDDSLAVLKSARQYGIKHLLSVSKSDSMLPKTVVTDFPAIEDFRELMPGL